MKVVVYPYTTPRTVVEVYSEKIGERSARILAVTLKKACTWLRNHCTRIVESFVRGRFCKGYELDFSMFVKFNTRFPFETLELSDYMVLGTRYRDLKIPLFVVEFTQEEETEEVEVVRK